MPSDFNERRQTTQTTDNNPGWRDGHLAIPDAERLAYERGKAEGRAENDGLLLTAWRFAEVAYVGGKREVDRDAAWDWMRANEKRYAEVLALRALMAGTKEDAGQ